MFSILATSLLLLACRAQDKPKDLIISGKPFNDITPTTVSMLDSNGVFVKTVGNEQRQGEQVLGLGVRGVAPAGDLRADHVPPSCCGSAAAAASAGRGSAAYRLTL